MAARRKTKKKKKALKKKPTPAMQFILAYLKRNRTANFDQVSKAAKKKRLTIFPVQYGRARLDLGIIRKKRTPKKKKATKRKKATRRSSAQPSAMGSLQAIMAEIKRGQRERDKLRKALGTAQAALDKASAALREALEL